MNADGVTRSFQDVSEYAISKTGLAAASAKTAVDAVRQKHMKSESRVPLPSFVLITAARNEEEHLERTILAIVSQTVRPVRWIIVNDGSTDSTPGIIDRYASSYAWITRLDMPQHRDRSFAAKANCVNSACRTIEGLPYEVIGNIDADITFESDYLEFLLKKFAEIPDLGVAGTPLLAAGGYDTAKDSFEGENYVAGPCQLISSKLPRGSWRLRSQQSRWSRLDRSDNGTDERLDDAIISGEEILSSS